MPNGNLIIHAGLNIVNVNDSGIRLAANQRYETISHWYRRQDIFPHTPRVQDIIQSNIGSCGFLAALGCIVYLRPNAILNMMVDERGGHVVVRLYDIITGAARYYRIQKTWVVGRTGATHDDYNKHTAPWVALLEKACAYHFMGRNFTPLNGGGPQVSATFQEALTGLRAEDTFKALLNHNARTENFEAMRAGSSGEAEFLNLMRLTNQNVQNDSTSRELLRNIFYSEVRARNFLNVNDAVADLKKYTNALYRINDAKQDKIIRRDTVAQYLDDNYAVLQSRTRACINLFVKDLFPGKRGSGMYNREQVRIYKMIRAALDENRGVVLASVQPIGVRDDELGNAGEHVARGLAAPHGYQVLDAYKSVNGLCWVTVRNPWGRYGREYEVNEQKNLKAVGRLQVGQNRNGVFDLELSDLDKRFSSCAISDPL